MTYRIEAPKSLNEISVKLPSSKSISNRVLIINALSYSGHAIKNLSDSDDTKVLYKSLKSNETTFDIGAAGTSMRFLTAFLSKIVGEWTVTGSERMKQRPIGILVDALNNLGAKIEYIEKDGYPPLRIFGSNLKGGKLQLQGNISSQFISAILMIAPTIEGGLELELTGEIISRPYINLTLHLMEEFGVKGAWKNDHTITIPEKAYTPVEYSVESDWSGASYWYQMVALSENGSTTLQGLKRYSPQGDSKIAQLFEQLGVKTNFTKKGTVLTKELPIVKKMTYNFINEPDMAQTFVVACCFLGVHFKFTGLQSLKIKETDRITALIVELRKFGFIISTNNVDTMEWNGEKEEIKNSAISIATYHDHRMALAFAPATQVHGTFNIENPEVITKSYPFYWDDLKEAGFKVYSEQ